MELITEILPIIGGGTSILNCFILFQLHNMKQDINREKQNFLDFVEEEKQEIKALDRRLNSLELQAARRWSTWRRE